MGELRPLTEQKHLTERVFPLLVKAQANLPASSEKVTAGG